MISGAWAGPQIGISSTMRLPTLLWSLSSGRLRSGLRPPRPADPYRHRGPAQDPHRFDRELCVGSLDHPSHTGMNRRLMLSLIAGVVALPGMAHALPVVPS